MLHHDGRWTHEGQPIRNRRVREHFDRSVKYLHESGKYVVTLRHFRGEIEVEEAAFFVREIDLATGVLRLSDRSAEPLDVASLHVSKIDGALLCRVKRAEAPPAGALARFTHGAQAELLTAVEGGPEGFSLLMGGRRVAWPEALAPE